MEDFNIGLRCQDIHTSASTTLDPNAQEAVQLEDTILVGMAASLASMIRGRDVIADAAALKRIAAEQLDINPYAYDNILSMLSDIGWVSPTRSGGKISAFTETIPLYEDLYSLLGGTWRERQPSELERAVVATTERLSIGVIPLDQFTDQLGIDRKDQDQVLQIAAQCDLARVIELSDGKIAYSPLLFFENPDQLGPMLETHTPSIVQEALHRVREYQGLPISGTESAALQEAVSRGLVMAPTVERPDQVDQAFVFLPYLNDRRYLKARKPILDKALNILACVRCGEHFGGATDVADPILVLSALLDNSRDNMLRAHSSHKRQYQMLFRSQIVDFIPSGNWVRPKLLTTPDNVEAVKLALQILRYGQSIGHATTDAAVTDGGLLDMGAKYLPPIVTVQRQRTKQRMSDKQFGDFFHAVMGFKAL